MLGRLSISMQSARLVIFGGNVETNIDGGVDDLEADVFDAEKVQTREIPG